jgi:hypothetical protein
MTKKMLALAGIVLTLGACTGPPPPPQVGAFQGIFKADAATVPANAAVTMSRPIGFMTSENVEKYIGFIKGNNEYWAQRVPATLTNTVVLADNDPMYFSGRLLAMLKANFPDIERVHDFPDAAAKGKNGVVLIDLRMKYMEPFGDRNTKVDVDAYFFDSSMNPVSKLSGHGEHFVPMASMDGGIQKSIDAAIRELDAKIKAQVRVR